MKRERDAHLNATTTTTVTAVTAATALRHASTKSYTPVDLLAWSTHAHCHDRSLPVHGTAVNPLLRAAYLQLTNTRD
jgi:hypothetical protein